MKLPIALAAAVAYAWMMSHFWIGQNAVPMGSVVISMAIGQWVVGSAYPIALLIIMTRKSVAQYYQTQLK
jgi:hypothetical protein